MTQPGPNPARDSLLVRAEDLSKQLRNRKIFSYRKNKRSSQHGVIEIQKILVVIDYQGDTVSDLALTEKEKLYDGSMRYNSDMSESDIRIEIVRLVKQNNIPTHELLIPKILILFGVSIK